MRLRGKAFVYKRPGSSAVGSGKVGVCSDAFDVARETTRLHEAILSARHILSVQAESQPIFEAHLEMIDDPMLSENAEEAIIEGLNAENAVRKASENICAMFSEIEDEYLRARADDVKDVCLRILNCLEGSSTAENPFASLESGSIIVADDLFPSDTALMDFSRISGLITARGSSTSHVCIIARAKGIPALTGYDISGISTGEVIDIEVPDSGPGTLLESIREAIGERNVRIYANASSAQEVRRAIESGAEGIGLFRTEFLFMGESRLPSVEEQAGFYYEALSACQGKPLVVRTLDIGGDKALPCLPIEAEDNPFMGLRGVRFCQAHPQILRDQISALMLAFKKACGSGLNPRMGIMFPMISTLQELQWCRSLLPADLPEGLSLGIMVETPAAVLSAEELANNCDFFSIGTNDLTQYVMAADRGNAAVSALYLPSGKAVLKAVEMTVEAARKAGISVGVCGESASNPDAARCYSHIGVNYLSLSGLSAE